MQPKIQLLTDDLLYKILDEAYQLMVKPGLKVQSVNARQLLRSAGALVDETMEVVQIPEYLVHIALETVPSEFFLFDLYGKPCVHYGGDDVHFDPGSSGVHILNPETREHRPSQSADLIRIVQVTEMLPQLDAQSTAVVCNEVPKAIGDLYRLYLVLLHSAKPVVTGAFAIPTLHTMIEMLEIMAGGSQQLAGKPRAIFDVCPSPPLIWSDFGAENLIILAHARVPAQLISMPLAGAAAPVTLLGSVVQHAAESLAGVVIHQLANPGAPIVWGGAPAIFDMRRGTTPMGAIETAMIDACYAQVGKHLGLPTHTYLGASDSKVIDYQSGLESGISALVGSLAGINMISGAGMLDFLACFSPEKLVLDAEAIGMAKRLLAGVTQRTETLALEMFENFLFKGDFLKQKLTRQLFSQEQYLPSHLIDRDSIRGWQHSGGLDSSTRAKNRVNELVRAYQTPSIPPEARQELVNHVEKLSSEAGMNRPIAY
jgi:trimethylamine--corrinoid protein Co-methyltransferase